MTCALLAAWRGARSEATGAEESLGSKGVGDNALVASLLIGQSERYWARWH